MKHFVIKLVVVAGFMLSALPHLFAQQTDTVLTIYGKKFAPGAKVYFNGTLIDSTQVTPDAVQPSRILRVRVLLSLLQTPPGMPIAGAKDGSATLNSTSITHKIRVVNPDQQGESADYEIIVERPVPAINFIVCEVLNTLQRLKMSVPIGTTSDSLICLQVAHLPVGTEIQLSVGNPLEVSIWDSVGTHILSSIRVVKDQTTYSFRIRYIAGSTLPSLSNMSVQTTLTARARIGNSTIARTLPLELQPVQVINIIAAYTSRADTGKSYGDINTETMVLQPSVESFLKRSLNMLNEYISTLNQTSGKLAQTRFRFTELPFVVSYQEQSNTVTGHLHSDIDALQGNDTNEEPLGRSDIPEIRQRQETLNPSTRTIILLLTNSEALYYRAIASSCQSTGLPKYIVVEAKYAETFIKLMVQGDDTKYVFDKKFIQALQQALQ